MWVPSDQGGGASGSWYSHTSLKVTAGAVSDVELTEGKAGSTWNAGVEMDGYAVDSETSSALQKGVINEST